jgi:outer membrane receptor for ferrienterochelin and colicins
MRKSSAWPGCQGFRRWVAASASALSVSWAFGQNTGVVDLTELSLEELLSIPVYAPSRRAQAMTDAPSYVTVVTADEIRRYGYRTLADVLNGVSGFHVTYDRLYRHVGVRGFGQPGDCNMGILLLINGMRTNENIFDSASVGTEFIMDLDLVERVEIARGPGSAIYGTSAFFAVVNVVTKTRMNVGHVETDMETASHGTYKGRATCLYHFENGPRVLFSATGYESAGQRLRFLEYDTAENGFGRTSRDTDAESFSDWFLAVAYHGLALQAGYGGRMKHVPTAAWGTLFDDARLRLHDRQGFVDAQFERDVTEWLALAARASYNTFAEDGWFPVTWDEIAPDTVVNRDVVRGEWWSAEAKLTAAEFHRHRAALGAEYRWNARQDEGNYDVGGDTYLDDRRQSAVWSMYVQDEVRVAAPLRLDAGLRYDEYESFGGEFSPRVALLWKVRPETTAKFLFGRAFRAPNANELYYHDGGISRKANPDLDPERIATYEAVVERKFGPPLHGTLSVYHYDLDDLIVQRVDPADDLIAMRNVDRVTAGGLEAALRGKWASGFQGRASYSFCEAVNRDTHERLTNAPRHLGKLQVAFPVWGERLTGGADLLYVDERLTLAGDEADAYTVVNLTLLSRWPSDRLEVAATFYNLFDETYADPGGAEHRQDLIEQDGRGFRVKATCRF